MTIRTSRIRRLKSLILALPLLALPIIAAAQDDSSAKPVITFAVIGDTGTGDDAQLSVARQMVRQREKTPFEFVIMLGDNFYEKVEAIGADGSLIDSYTIKRATLIKP